MLGLKPIQLLPARERVAAALRKAIISKQISEGEVLTLENTAQELGVSITPVREAFQILARDGLIELKQSKGAVVLGINETTIREHYQVRAALESAACALCCENDADLEAAIPENSDDAVDAFMKVIQAILRIIISPSTMKSGKHQATRRFRKCWLNCGTDFPSGQSLRWRSMHIVHTRNIKTSLRPLKSGMPDK